MLWNHISLLRKPVHWLALTASLSVTGQAVLLNPVLANSRDQAYTLHTRIAGVPPTPAVLNSMAQKIDTGQSIDAAYEAMEDSNFYNTTLRNFVTPWTNKDQSVFADLNDYTATVIGLIRDERPFTQTLTADVVYVGASNLNLPAYAQNNNDHYIAMQEAGIDLGDPSQLVSTMQTQLPNTPLTTDATAGVLTTRAAAAEFFFAGTNRAMVRFTLMNYMCRDLEQLKDITRPSNFIRQDVSRAPGGDSAVFLNNCIGCHSGLDAVAKAFAYYDWDQNQAQIVYTPNQVTEKHLINSSNFPLGYVTTNDSWVNYWRNGPNTVLGWNPVGAGRGSGAKSFGAEIAGSRAFSTCQVEKTFQQVCLREPTTGADLAAVERIADVFENNQYSMKRVFAETAVHCMGN